MPPLPAVDFAAIKGTAQEAIALYGTTATFGGDALGPRPVKCVVYRDQQPAALLQDVQSEAAKALLSPADFAAPHRFPQQFDTLTVDIEGFRRIYTIEDVHPVLAENKLALIIATIKGELMSTAAVRAAFRAEFAAAFPALPLYDTLGVRVDNNTLPDLWGATDFIPISDAAISIGSPTCHREIGTFRAYVVGKTGAGDAAVIAQADAILAHFRSWRDAPLQLRVTGAIPPAPSEFSDGRWLICAVDFAFSHDHYV